MDYLRAGIGLRAMGQRDPLTEYQREAYDMFADLVDSVKRDAVRYLFHVQVAQQPAEQPKQVTTSGPTLAPKQAVAVTRSVGTSPARVGPARSTSAVTAPTDCFEAHEVQPPFVTRCCRPSVLRCRVGGAADGRCRWPCMRRWPMADRPMATCRRSTPSRPPLPFLLYDEHPEQPRHRRTPRPSARSQEVPLTWTRRKPSSQS